MLPLLIIPGVILLAGAVLSGDSENPPPTKLDFDKDPDTYKTYQKLKEAGVSDKEMDRGAYFIVASGRECKKMPFGETRANDRVIHREEVHETAYDLFLRYPEDERYKEILKDIYKQRVKQGIIPFEGNDIMRNFQETRELICLDPMGVSLKLYVEALKEVKEEGEMKKNLEIEPLLLRPFEKIFGNRFQLLERAADLKQRGDVK